MNQFIFILTFIAIVQGHHKSGPTRRPTTEHDSQRIHEDMSSKRLASFGFNSKNSKVAAALKAMTSGCVKKFRDGRYHYFC